MIDDNLNLSTDPIDKEQENPLDTDTEIKCPCCKEGNIILKGAYSDVYMECSNSRCDEDYSETDFRQINQILELRD